jgi:hypothetical protein
VTRRLSPSVNPVVALAALVLVALVLVLGACGSAPPDDRASIPLQGFTTTTPPPPTEPPTPAELEARLLRDYRSDWAAILEAYASSSVVGLHRVSSGPVLYGISDDILHGVRYGLVWSGAMTHHPSVDRMEAGRALVTDCILVADAVHDSLSGEVLGEGQEWVELLVELVSEDHTWKLYDFDVLGYDCEPPTPSI